MLIKEELDKSLGATSYRGYTWKEEWAKRKGDNKKFRVREHQFDFLISRGLKPEHYLLDIGCGWLRGGHLFMGYLETGHYYGIDKEAWLIRVGIEGIEEFGLEGKAPALQVVKNLDVSKIDVKFDFMLAQSVFTHMTKENIELCIRNVLPLLKPNGKFYATFFVSETFEISGPHKNRQGEFTFSRQPVEFYTQSFQDICKVNYIGSWGHINDQHMLEIKLGG